MRRVIAAVRTWTDGCDGQDLLEYALLAALIALVVIAGITSVGSAIQTVFWTPIAQTF
jgi:Flp pilus assembly pilin Flp